MRERLTGEDRPMENRRELNSVSKSLCVRTGQIFHGPPRVKHAVTDEGGSCWGEEVGDVIGRVIMGPAENGQAVFMRLFRSSEQDLLFCQTGL